MMIDTLNLSEGNRVALVYCSAEPNSVYQVNKMTEYLSAEGIVCTSYKFADSNEMQAVAEKAAGENDAIYVPTDNTVASYTSIIDNVCAPKKIPVFAGEESTCLGCGYATLAISYYNIGLKTGQMAAKVLLGEIDITEMAIEYDAEPVKKYNRRSCENLGIDIDALEAKGYVAIEE
jgi:putative ABC transport system substrate-binding protein